MNRSTHLAAALVVLAACGGSSDKKTTPPPPPPVGLETFQAAAFAIGQGDLTTGTAPTTCAAGSLDTPYGASAWDGTRLFIPDTNGNRAHAYSGIPTASGASPAFDLGQADCSSATDPTTASQLSSPQSIRAVGGKLVVADSTNNRVLVWNTTPGAAGAAANVAVGQADLASWTQGACTDKALDAPQSAFVTTGGKLIVADQNHHRVLVWNAIPTASGTAADLVLGQASMTACIPNDDPLSTPGQVTAATLNAPSDVWSDGTRLVVVDSGNNRVLVWSTFPTANGEAADAVLGQAAFTTSGSGASASTMAGPIAVASDGTRLFVADQGNNRVLAFGAIPATGGGASATVVLGQGDFTHTAANDADQDGTPDAGPSANTLSFPSGLAVIDGKLFVTDALNHRVVVFVPPAP